MVSVIILAGGKGLRVGSCTPKQFLWLEGKPVVLHSFEVFASLSFIKEIIVVAPEVYHGVFTSPTPRFALPGVSRQESLFNGSKQLSSESQWVVVHDAARPIIKPKTIEKLVEAGKEHGAATLAVPIKWTIKRGSTKGFVEKTLDRSMLWEIQTPQILKKEHLDQGEILVRQQNLEVTDDVALAELLGHPVKLVEGDNNNLKITTKEDLSIAATLLKAHAQV